MRVMDKRCGVLMLSVYATLPALPAAGAVPAEVEAALARLARFTPAEIASLDGGTVIAHVEGGQDDTEVFVVAGVKIRTTREQALGYYGQLIAYVDGKVTLGFGKFSSPPALADVQGMSLTADEIQSLKACQPKDCDLKLAGAGIERLRASVDWKSSDAAAQVNALVRQAAVDYVTAYLKSGDDVLISYDDRSKPVSLKAQWHGLLEDSPHFQTQRPELKAYLAEFPRQALPGAKDVLYWVNENYGLKPVLSIVHGVIYQPPQQPERTLVFQKQIYASHYYNASAALAIVLEAQDGGAPVTYVVYSNRSRGDLLKGGFGGLKRKVARDQALSAAKDTLGSMKTVLEKQPAR